MVAWMRWINEMIMERHGNKGYLSMERKYAQVQVQRVAQNPNQRAKIQKNSEKKKLRKPGCHKPTPLRKNLVLEIWLLREPLKTYRP